MDVGAIANLGTALSAARIETEFTALALVRQQDTLQALGQNAIHLIQAALLEPGTGQQLDIHV